MRIHGSHHIYAIPQKSLAPLASRVILSEAKNLCSHGTETLRSAQGDKVSFALLHIYSKPGSIVRLSVPIHGNQPLKVGLLRHLLKMAELTESDIES